MHSTIIVADCYCFSAHNCILSNIVQQIFYTLVSFKSMTKFATKLPSLLAIVFYQSKDMFAQLSRNSQLIFLSRAAPATYYNPIIHNNNIKVLCCVHVCMCADGGESEKVCVIVRVSINTCFTEFIPNNCHSHGICMVKNIFIANQLKFYLIESVEIIPHVIGCYIALMFVIPS